MNGARVTGIICAAFFAAALSLPATTGAAPLQGALARPAPKILGGPAAAEQGAPAGTRSSKSRPMSRVLGVRAAAARAAGIRLPSSKAVGVCSVPAPVIGVSPSPIVVPPNLRATVSAPQPFTIQNTGTGNLVVTGFFPQDPPGLPCECGSLFNVVDTNGCVGATIPPGGSCTAFTTFRADDQLDTDFVVNGTIDVASNDPANPYASFPVEGTIGQGVITTGASRLDFGARTFSPSSPLTLPLSLTNGGTAAITVQSVFVFGSNSARYSVAAGTCSAIPFALGPGNSCDLSVTFTPNALGVFGNTTLQVSFNDGATIFDFENVELTGTGVGVGGAFAFSPSGVNFFSVPLGQTTPFTSVIATNLDSLLSHAVTNVIVGSPFWVNGDDCTLGGPIPPGGSCEILVYADGNLGTLGANSGNITFSSPTAGGDFLVPLSVNFVPNLAWNPSVQDFPDTPVGGPAATISYTLENYDPIPHVLETISFSFPLPEITISGGTCLTLTVPASPGGGIPGTCTLDLQYLPVSGGFSSVSVYAQDAATSTFTYAYATGFGIAPGPRLSFSPGDIVFPLGATGVPSQLPLTITNIGDAPTPTALSFAPSDPEVTIDPGTCTGPIPASGSCTLNVNYSRATVFTDPFERAYVIVQTTDAGPTITEFFYVYGTTLASVPAAIEAFPGTVSFPATLVGTDSAPVEISLGNTGSGGTPLAITSIVSSSPQFIVTNDCPLSPSQLGTQSCCLATVTFRPTGPGVLPGSLTVTTSAGNVVIGLDGTGIVAAAPGVAKSFAPSSVAVGQVSTLTVTLTNSNGFPLSSVAFADNYPSGIANAPSPAVTNTCGGTVTATPGAAGFSLAGGAMPSGSPSPSTCSVTVGVIGLFTSPGLVNTIAIGAVTSAETTGSASLAASAPLAVTGSTALASAISFTPGNIPPGGVSTLDLNFSNPNPANFTGGSLAYTLPAGLAIANPTGAAILGGAGCTGSVIASPGAPSFSVSGFTVPTSGACDIQVGVTAASPGSYPATLAAGALAGNVLVEPTGNAVPAVSPVTLTVTAAAAPVLTLSPPPPGPLDFGPVTVANPSPPLNVAISNTGTAPLSFSGAFAVTGDFAQTATTCGATLPPPPGPGNACTSTIVFTPSATGPRSGTFGVSSTGGNAVLNLAGTGVAAPVPAISLSVGSLGFATRTVGTTSPPQAVTVTSAGTAPLVVSGVSVNGDFAVSSACTSVSPLAPSASCGIDVTFTPVIPGTRTGQLTVASNDPGSPASVVTLNGTGVAAPSPSVSLSPTTLAFPSTTAQQMSAAKTATLANSGGAPLQILSMDLVGTGFSTSNDCGGSVASGASCTISAIFAPPAAGSFAADLRIVTNAPGGPSFLRLTGTATAAPVGRLAAAPSSLSFSDQVLGTASAAQPLAITNAGAATASVSRISVTGDYALEGSCFDLRPGESCTLLATFTPTQLGTRAGQVVVTSDAANSPLSIALSGRGVPLPAPRVSLSASALGFGNTLVGTPATQAVTVTNSGTRDLVLGTVAATGDYHLANGCTGTLPPAGSCRIDVTFLPSIPGPRSGGVTILSNAEGSPHRVDLMGTGCRLALTGRTLDLVCAP